jgi:DNA invertase Pin-like site-specific DNA recombinase
MRRAPSNSATTDADLWIVYVRRSYKRADSADVSDEQQEAASRALVPAGAPIEVIRDSGGHQSGASDQREGYQYLLSKVASGRTAGIAVYDLSRLARNAGLMLPLKAELERRSIPIRVATMPNTCWDGAIGRYMFGQLALAAQLQRDLDSERMVGLSRTIFEGGGHCGSDPFGYVTVRDARGNIVRPGARSGWPASTTCLSGETSRSPSTGARSRSARLTSRPCPRSTGSSPLTMRPASSRPCQPRWTPPRPTR